MSLVTNRFLFSTQGSISSVIVNKRSRPKASFSTSRASSIFQLLSLDESTLLAEQRALTARAAKIAKHFPSIVSNFSKTSPLPESTFAIVICGEFNAGKSTLLNALLGAHVLETGPLPTTDCITVLMHGETETTVGDPHQNTIHYTSPQIPPDVLFVDTPGTNSVVLHHTLTTQDLLPSADLIFFCTSADRPFSQSERILLQQMQHYRKSIVVVINKMDILEHTGGDHGAMAKQYVIDFVTEHAADLLGARPVVFPISARDALYCKTNNMTEKSPMYDRSQFNVLETYLQTHLTTETKIKAKLLTPIGTVQAVTNDCLELLRKEDHDLQTDSATLKLLQSHCVSWVSDMKSELDRFRHDMRHILIREGSRGQKFINRFSLLHLFWWGLIDQGRLVEEWKKHEIKWERDLHVRVQEISTLMNSRIKAQSQAVVEYLGKRPAIRSQSLVGSISPRWTDSSFQALLQTAVDEVVLSNSSATTSALRVLHQRALLAAFCQFMAITGGFILVTSGMDQVISLTVAVATSTGGGFAMHQGRPSFIKDHQHIWHVIEMDLDEILQTISEKELAKCNATIMDGVAPYTRFVESEQQRLNELINESEDILTSAQTLRNRIHKLMKF